MPRPGQIDHVAQGLAALPELARQPNNIAYLTIYLEAYNAQEELQQELFDAFLYWATGVPVYSFVYETIGVILDQPRPDGFSDADYRFVLLARARSRKSEGTLNDVLVVCEYLARGNPFIVQPTPPKAYVMAFTGLGLNDQWEGLYESILLAAVGQCDLLSIYYTSSSTAVYDSLSQTYDAGTYA